ncbi:hypothetical protein, partial [Pedobacter sp.]|uniref:hypothetical protein n=1 Tax=Pedobacter sp. TaxID=1411316 RepID=UPI003D7F8A47
KASFLNFWLQVLKIDSAFDAVFAVIRLICQPNTSRFVSNLIQLNKIGTPQKNNTKSIEHPDNQYRTPIKLYLRPTMILYWHIYFKGVDVIKLKFI